MAETLHFDLVSPERRVASGPALEVRIPGIEGDMAALPGHVPLVTTLRPGVVRVRGEDGGTEEYCVVGGAAQITADGVMVLAEDSLHVSEVTQEAVDRFFEAARRKQEEAKKQAEETEDYGIVDDAAKIMSDMASLATDMGYETRGPAPS